jgi:hypothetical protein
MEHTEDCYRMSKILGRHALTQPNPAGDATCITGLVAPKKKDPSRTHRKRHPGAPKRGLTEK